MLSLLLEYYFTKTYTYNPHIHVKIWFSKDPDQFLIFINQLRLIRMRELNPKDTIHFIYDRELLSEKAYENLQFFCKKHRIISHDVYRDIFGYCSTNEEIQIINLYKDEVAHLNEGGNLGAASDCIRILKPVYDLGTYSDFDAPIDTRTLPETISVKAPIIINVQKNNDGRGFFGNDVFSVVDSKAAEETIKALQKQLIENCTRRHVRSSKPTDASLPLFSEQKIKNLLIQCLEAGYSIREFRNFIIHLNVVEYIKIKPDSFEQFLSCVQTSKKENGLNKQMLKQAVMISTGPTMYVEAMTKYVTLFTILYRGKIADSFQAYQLNEAFKGQSESNPQNDCSWLSPGHDNLVNQEKLMAKHAIKIQRFFSKHRSSQNTQALSTENLNIIEASY